LKVNCEGLPGPVAKCQGWEAWDGEGGGGCGKDGRKADYTGLLAGLRQTSSRSAPFVGSDPCLNYTWRTTDLTWDLHFGFAAAASAPPPKARTTRPPCKKSAANSSASCYKRAGFGGKELLASVQNLEPSHCCEVERLDGLPGCIQRYLFEPREAPSREKSCCYSFGSHDLHGSLAPAPRVRPS
jgi:hypothetical protein